MNTKRFMRLTDLPKQPKGHCRWCGNPVPKGRRRWCSQRCVDEFTIRAWPSHVRHIVFRRDKGVCAICHIDNEAERAKVAEARQEGWRQRKAALRWEVDHIVPVGDGGGGCGLDNLQTLCVPCHRAKTARQAAEKALRRRTAKQPEFL